MNAHEYLEEMKKLQTDLVDIENTVSKLKKEKEEITEKILELTRTFQKSDD